MSNWFDKDYWHEILHTLGRNKMRSILTVFGVFWGVFMLIVMSGSGSALENGIKSGVENVSTNSLFVWANNTTEAYKGHKKGRSWTLKSQDAKILKERIPELITVTPLLFTNSYTNNVSYSDRTGTFNVKGLYPDYQTVERQSLLFGRFINDIDIDANRKVCIIGKQVYETLFPDKSNPLGKNISVNGIFYTVVGVMEHSSKNMNLFGRTEETIILPYTTMQQIINTGDNVYIYAIVADDNASIENVEKDVKKVLRETHQISPTDEVAVSGFNLGVMFKRFFSLFSGINILIWIVGGGTLLAGVVGVTNIMLISVKERTKEIGIRRALGAKPLVIVQQILSETLILTLLAGLTGIVMGVGALNLMGKIITASGNSEGFFRDPQISFTLAVGATLILIIFGTLAGLIPVIKALSIKAIDAIREE